jgi:RimJ/RimL family protein N-acetyltransferase
MIAQRRGSQRRLVRRRSPTDGDTAREPRRPGTTRTASEGDAAPAPLEGGRVVLRVLSPADHGWLYALATHPSNGYRWRYGGATPSPEMFVHSLWDRVLAQFAIVQRSTGRPVGLVVAYAPDLHSGHVQVAALLDPSVQRRAWPMEAMFLFVNYLFTNWNLRKVYAESLEFNYLQFASGAGRLFDVEARLRAHHFWNGRYWDKVIGHCSRERWMQMGPRLMRFARPA